MSMCHHPTLKFTSTPITTAIISKNSFSPILSQPKHKEYRHCHLQTLYTYDYHTSSFLPSPSINTFTTAVHRS